jgi:transcriptional regulator with XRE-family HTH domain
MKELRLFGNMIEKLCKEQSVSYEMLCEKLNCTISQLSDLLKGCVVPTFKQLESISELFQTTIETLLAGDNEHYEKTVVSCMAEFKDPDAREEILDIIENYAELATVVN